jgi:hypothetical protein
LLFASALAIALWLPTFGVGRLSALLAVALVFIKPVAFPQFTVLAGLLSATGFLGVLHHFKAASQASLVAACLFLIFGFLVRSQSLYLVVCLAIPFLPWRLMRKSRPFATALTATAAVLLAASVVDKYFYMSDEWQAFFDLNSVRLAFNDYGVADYFSNRDDVLAAHGFSENDLRLVENWFFVDQRVSDSQRLSALLKEIEPLAWLSSNVGNLPKALGSLQDATILPLLLGALAVTMTSRERQRGILGLGLVFAVVTSLAVLGRPSVLRVYYPALATVLVLAMAWPGRNASWRPSRFIVLLVAAVWALQTQYSNCGVANENAARVAEDMTHLPRDDLVVLWGGWFPYEQAFPVFNGSADEPGLRLFPLNAFSLAPPVSKHWIPTVYEGFMDRLLKGEAIPTVAPKAHLRYLDRHCRDHFDRQLQVENDDRFQEFTLYRVTCRKNSLPCGSAHHSFPAP